MTNETPETQPNAAEISENLAAAPASEPEADLDAEPTAAAPEWSGQPAAVPTAEPAVEPVVSPVPEPAPEAAEDFGELLAQFEKTHAHSPKGGTQLQGTVISVSAEQVFLGYRFQD